MRLREADITPTPALLKEIILGTSYDAYTKFQEGLEQVEIDQVWQYYPCMGTKAWLARGVFKWITPRCANKEKNIYWLSAWDGYFRVAIWFKEKNRAEILNAYVSDETKKLIRSAKMLGPKMQTFPVEFEVRTTEPLADIFTLIKYKKRLEA